MSKNKILEKIKKGRIKMKPKSYFVFRTILFAIGIILAFIFTVFIIGFILFNLRVSGAWHFPAFGFPGLGLFFVSLPWLLIVLAIIFILILEIFAKKFSIVYKKPLLYSVIGIRIIVLILGIFIAQTPMHKGLFDRARQGKMPFMRPPHNAYIGNVENIIDNGFEIKTKEGENFRIIISSKTHFPFGNKIEQGESVMIMGKKQGSSVEAFGIRRILFKMK